MQSPIQRAAAMLGRITSPTKAAAARANGRKGGRPRINFNEAADRRQAVREAMRQAITRADQKRRAGK